MTDERVVVLTGASSGIARAAAVAFAERGARVVLSARDGDSLRAVAEACTRAGGSAVTVPADVGDETAVRELARQAHEAFGRIDVWINGAAVMAYGKFEDTPSEVYRQTIETNLLGQIHGARAVLPHFRARGTGVLINIGSVWATVTSPYVSAYVVSKFGVRAFTESLQQALRLERGMKHVHVCMVLPQSVDTPIFRHAANYTGKQVKPVPPVLGVPRVVRAILRTADHPRRRRTVGIWGRLLETAHAVAPGLFGDLVPTVMQHAALGRRSTRHSPGNVFEPEPEWNAVEGNWRNKRLRAGMAAGFGLASAAAARRLWRSRAD